MKISLSDNKVITCTALELGIIQEIVTTLKYAKTMKERNKLLTQIKNFLLSSTSLYGIKLPKHFTITSISEQHHIETQDTLFHFYYKELLDVITENTRPSANSKV